MKGQTQLDYIVAVGGFFLVMIFIVNITTSYLEAIKQSSDLSLMRGQTFYVFESLQREPEPASWPHISANESQRLNLWMEENHGNIIHDKSLYGNNLTIYGARWNSSCLYGRCIYFSGNDYAAVSDNPSLGIGSKNFTIEFWAKTDKLTGEQNIISKTDGNAGYRIFFSDDRYSISIKGASTVNVISSASIDNNWHHYAFVIDRPNNQLRLYKDGEQDPNTGSAGFGNADSSSDFILGKYSSNYFNGTIDEVVLYDKILPAEEIMNHCKNPIKRIGLNTDVYRIIVEVSNIRPYYKNQGQPSSDMNNELAYVDLSSYPEIDFDSVSVYNSTDEISYQRQGTFIIFSASVAINANSTYFVYFSSGTEFNEKNTTITGNDNLTEIIYPAEKIPALGYEKMRNLNRTSVEFVKNSTIFDRDFEISLVDYATGEQYWRFGDDAPKRSDIYALQRYVMYQNETAGIKQGQILVKLW